MQAIGSWFSKLKAPVQIAVVVVVGVAVVVGLLLGGNFFPTINGLLGVK